MATADTHPRSHSLWLRLSHWLNALAVFIMITSGWQIYNASPLFHWLHFSHAITLGGWLAGGLWWHFAAMWLLAVNGIFYLAMNLATGRLKRKFFPVRGRELLHEFGQALRLKLQHTDLTHYNALQKLAYLVAMLATLVLIMSGMVLWKSVQFPWLRTLFGDYDTARLVHFCAMSVLAGFIAVHVALVAIVPRTLVGMVRGRF